MAKKRNKLAGQAKSTSEARVAGQEQLLSDLRKLIHEAQTRVAQTVNSALVLLYWQLGDRIRTEILKSKRAAYGDEILSTLSKELVAEYGSGYSVPNLSRMTRLAEYFPDRHIVAALSRQLSWSHFVEILPLRDDLKREFYAEMCRIERWSVRCLVQQGEQGQGRAGTGRAGTGTARWSARPDALPRSPPIIQSTFPFSTANVTNAKSIAFLQIEN